MVRALGAETVFEALEAQVSQFGAPQASTAVPEMARVAAAGLALFLGGEPSR